MNIEEQLFRDFLIKIKYHRYLEYYILCRKIIFEDESLEAKETVVKEIATYLQQSPSGHNLAMRSQKNRYDLLYHCQNLQSIKNLNHELFKESYNYVFMKLVEKYLFFIRAINRK